MEPSFIRDWQRSGLPAVQEKNPDLRLQAQDLVLFPIHSPAEEPHGHWSLVVAWPKKHTIKVFDSRGNPRLHEG